MHTSMLVYYTVQGASSLPSALNDRVLPAGRVTLPATASGVYPTGSTIRIDFDTIVFDDAKWIAAACVGTLSLTVSIPDLGAIRGIGTAMFDGHTILFTLARDLRPFSITSLYY